MTDMTKLQEDTDELGFFDDSSALVETLEACWSIGPLEVCAKLVSSDRIDVVIKLAGVKIGSGSITTANNKLCAGANVGVVKANLCVSADFPNKVVWVEGKFCSRKIIGGWSCRNFKTKILSW
jgi:hypothetical protein